MTNIIGIYKITSPSGRMYIGQSWNIKKRWKDHRNAKKLHGRLVESLKKYGWKNHIFEIVHELPLDVDQSVMDVYECLYIAQYQSLGFKILNLRTGGARGKHTEESKNKMSVQKMGKFAGDRHPLYGKPRTEEVKEALRKANTGKKYSDELKAKLSAMRQGSLHPSYGKKRSEESKEKMRIAALNRNAEAKQNIINANKKRFGKM